MRQVLVIAVVIGAAGRADAGGPTCEDAVAHMMATAYTKAQVKAFGEDAMAKGAVHDAAQCEAAPWSDDLRACYVGAADAAAVTACQPPPATGLAFGLPAVSADGKTLAVKTELDTSATLTHTVVLLPIGKSKGEVLPEIVSENAGVSQGKTIEEHYADVNARLGAGGYATLPFFGDTPDGVTMTVSGTDPKHKVVWTIGKKVVAKTVIRGHAGEQLYVNGFVVLHGKTSWIYYAWTRYSPDGGIETGMTALKAKLPKKK